MTVIEYFISVILCIFQNQMECHFFSNRDVGRHCLRFPFKPHTPRLARLMTLGVSRGEEGRNKILPHCLLSLPAWPTPLPPPSPNTQTHCPRVGAPFPDPCIYTESKSQGHLTHPIIAKKPRVPDVETCPRSSFLFLVQALTFFRNAFLWSN